MTRMHEFNRIGGRWCFNSQSVMCNSARRSTRLVISSKGDPEHLNAGVMIPGSKETQQELRMGNREEKGRGRSKSGGRTRTGIQLSVRYVHDSERLPLGWIYIASTVSYTGRHGPTQARTAAHTQLLPIHLLATTVRDTRTSSS